MSKWSSNKIAARKPTVTKANNQLKCRLSKISKISIDLDEKWYKDRHLRKLWGKIQHNLCSKNQAKKY